MSHDHYLNVLERREDISTVSSSKNYLQSAPGPIIMYQLAILSEENKLSVSFMTSETCLKDQSIKLSIVLMFFFSHVTKYNFLK